MKKIKVTRVAVELPGIELPKEDKDKLKKHIRESVKQFAEVERLSVNFEYEEEDDN